MSRCQIRIGSYVVGDTQELLVIAGPCVLEDAASAIMIAQHLADVTADLPVQLVFKASFDKANRTSVSSYRGPGLRDGLAMLDEVRTHVGLPVTTDIHEPNQAAEVAEVCELLQIPAFLARQTDLLVAAAQTGRAVNVKKGQFMAPNDMRHVGQKLRESGCEDFCYCERGTFFGYGQLVNDMRALIEMRNLGSPVIFDATHSVQQPGSLNGTTGGNREMVAPLARAAAAVGIDGLFFETHPSPDESPSDGPNLVPLKSARDLLEQVIAVRRAVSPAE